MKNTTILLAALAVAFLLATCGSDEPSTTEPAGAFEPEPAGQVLQEPLLHNGFLYADDTGVYLVKTLAESYPPQPVGPMRPVSGLDLDTFPGLSTAEGITWSDQFVEILGTVVDGTLVVAAGS